MSAGSERSFVSVACCCLQSVFALSGHVVPLSPRHCLPSVFAGIGKEALSVRESLMPFYGQRVVVCGTLGVLCGVCL